MILLVRSTGKPRGDWHCPKQGRFFILTKLSTLNSKCQPRSFAVHLKGHLDNSQFNIAKPSNSVKEMVRSRLPLQLCFATFPPSIMCTVVHSCSLCLVLPQRRDNRAQLFGTCSASVFYCCTPARPVMKTVNSFLMGLTRICITTSSTHVHAMTFNQVGEDPQSCGCTGMTVEVI